MPQLAYSPHAAFQAGVQMHERQLERIRRQAMSARQLHLNWLYAFYACEQYDARATAWDGRKVMDGLEREQIARTQVLPPGFWDPSGSDDVPLSLRRPTAPYNLVRAVVNRFTGLLFSAKRHPTVRHAHPGVQQWIDGLVSSCRLWIRMAHARTLGGSMGSVALTFTFEGGRPVIEVHDTRWCTPTFANRASGELAALEIRYMYSQEIPDERGILRETWFWYRRVISQAEDVVFAPAPVGEGDEPRWVPQASVKHGFGECPGVWIRNTLTNEQDGDPDCHGEFDTQEAIDRLIAQADQAALENMDPTLLLETDSPLPSVLKKGSRNALKVGRGESAHYMEMAGSGIDAGLKMVETHKRNFLEIVQCVLDNDREGGARTATEIERHLEGMFERGDLFREQYGETGVKVLLAKMIRAAIKVRTTGATDPATGMRLVGAVRLPPAKGPDGQPVARELPPELREVTADDLELAWPEWVQRGPADAGAAASAVSAARSAQALDQESAVTYLAPFFNVEDPAAALERLRAEGAQVDDAMMGDIMGRGGMPALPPGGQEPEAAGAPAAPLDAKLVVALADLVASVTTKLAPLAAAHLLAFSAGMPLEVARAIVEAQAAAPPPPATAEDPPADEDPELEPPAP